jgi:hypothetical protein
MTYGGTFGDLNRNITAIGYMYTQAIDFDPDDTAQALRKRAIAEEGIDYEDLFLHFSEDTTFVLPNPDHASSTALAGVPWVSGYTASSGHAGFWLYQDPPWEVSAWAGHASGGALYVFLFERFDELDLTLGTGGGDGTLLVEYPSAVAPSTVAAEGVNVERLATEWSTMPLLHDATNNLQTSGVLRWKPPTSWEIASTHDGSGLTYGGTGPYMGKSALQKGGLAYVVRISWTPVNEDEALPKLNNVGLRRWIKEVVPGDNTVQEVPGWADENDGGQFILMHY